MLEESWGKRIVMLQGGWVMIGDLEKHDTYFSLGNGFVIRRWGTTQGLGELAIKGPLKETILDPVPQVQFHELTVVGIMKCDESKWPS